MEHQKVNVLTLTCHRIRVKQALRYVSAFTVLKFMFRVRERVYCDVNGLSVIEFVSEKAWTCCRLISSWNYQTCVWPATGRQVRNSGNEGVLKLIVCLFTSEC
jgi:hypothetical protein